MRVRLPPSALEEGRPCSDATGPVSGRRPSVGRHSEARCTAGCRSIWTTGIETARTRRTTRSVGPVAPRVVSAQAGRVVDTLGVWRATDQGETGTGLTAVAELCEVAWLLRPAAVIRSTTLAVLADPLCVARLSGAEAARAALPFALRVVLALARASSAYVVFRGNGGRKHRGQVHGAGRRGRSLQERPAAQPILFGHALLRGSAPAEATTARQTLQPRWWRPADRTSVVRASRRPGARRLALP
jgi:hypothetical protein